MSPARMRQLLRRTLTTDQIDLLARHCFDGQSQQEIGRDLGRAQTTINYRIRAALSRLEAAGAPAWKRRRRSETRGRQYSTDPATIDRMMRE